ncbi:MAG: MerR family transcriptional regulator [Chitinophagales bacterium]
MSQYSIKDLELLTGIKSHTLRIWESRYNVITPKRTKTNIRYYLDEDLRKILNVAHLNKLGYKISKIAKLSEEERNELVLENSVDCEQIEGQIQCLTKAMLNYDEQEFNHLLANATLKMGFERCMLEIAYPFLEKIGKLWQASSICVAQEHFVSNLLRQKIIVATDGQMLKDPENSKRAILFCPPGEIHELNLLFVNYILRIRNIHTLYLGTDMPLCDLSNVKAHYKPHCFVMAMTAGYAQKNQSALNEQLKIQLGDTPGFLIGSLCNKKSEWHKNIHLVKNIKELEKQLKSLV